MTIQPILKQHSGELELIVANLVAGTGAARDAFNRHSRKSMEELQTLNQIAAQQLQAALRELEQRLAGKSASPVFIATCRLSPKTWGHWRTPFRKR